MQVYWGIKNDQLAYNFGTSWNFNFYYHSDVYDSDGTLTLSYTLGSGDFPDFVSLQQIAIGQIQADMNSRHSVTPSVNDMHYVG